MQANKVILRQQVFQLLKDVNFKQNFPELLHLANQKKACCGGVSKEVYEVFCQEVEANTEKFKKFFGVTSLTIIKNKKVKQL